MNRRGGVFQLKIDSIYSAETKKRTAIISLQWRKPSRNQTRNRGVAEDLPQRIEVITLHYNAARDNNNIIERDWTCQISMRECRNHTEHTDHHAPQATRRIDQRRTVRHSQTRVTRVDSGKRFRGAEPM